MTAILVSFLFAHTMWVGSGFACVMPAMGQSSGAAMASVTDMPGMAGMGMAGMPDADMAAMDMSGTGGQPPDEAPAHDHVPCELPWAPGGCQSMAPCAPLAVTSAVQSLRAPDGVPSSVAAQSVLTPPSQVRPPELPPPRA